MQITANMDKWKSYINKKSIKVKLQFLWITLNDQLSAQSKKVPSVGGKISYNRPVTSNPPNIRLDEEVLKTSFAFVFRKRLQDVFKRSCWRPIYSSWPCVLKTFSRHFQDVFKTFSRPLQYVLQTRFQDIFNMSSRRLEDVLKDEKLLRWRRVEDQEMFAGKWPVKTGR